MWMVNNRVKDDRLREWIRDMQIITTGDPLPRTHLWNFTDVGKGMDVGGGAHALRAACGETGAGSYRAPRPAAPPVHAQTCGEHAQLCL